MADNKRLKRLKRMVDLQHRIKQQHEWKLADLQHQKTQLDEEREMLSNTLFQPRLSGDRLMELVGQQLARANEKERWIEVVKEHHNQQRTTQHQRLRHTEQIHKREKTAVHRETVSQELSEIIDLALLKKPT